LTEWASLETLEAGAASGAILETWIMTEILKTWWHNGRRAPFYFYRDNDQKEIDLIIMIKKIISGGQTGADRAALDFALKFHIPHGGWIPKGRLAEDGALPDTYQLKEMPTDSYAARTEQNVIDSDGTLIFSRGKPTGGTDLTREMTLKHKRQLLGIDLNLTSSYDAASLIVSWINLRRIKILNVAGPRDSEDPTIYQDVFKTLAVVVQMQKAEETRPANKSSPPGSAKNKIPPKTVTEAIEKLQSGLSLKDKATIANMAEIELSSIHGNLGEYLQKEFGLWSGNSDLLTSCGFFAKRDKISPNEATSIIIRELWKRLRESHKLRVVK
jgi:hypothetical protein